jgi:hypothetical protein
MLHRKQPSDTSLDLLIDEVHQTMRDIPADTEEFKLALGRLKELHKLKDASRPPRVSPDTVLIVCANLLGIVIITQHEKLDVITSKATGFVQKLR